MYVPHFGHTQDTGYLTKHTPARAHTHTHGPLKGCLMNVWLARLARADERLAIKWEMLKIICITYAPRLTAYLMQLR